MIWSDAHEWCTLCHIKVGEINNSTMKSAFIHNIFIKIHRCIQYVLFINILTTAETDPSAKLGLCCGTVLHYCSALLLHWVPVRPNLKATFLNLHLRDEN